MQEHDQDHGDREGDPALHPVEGEPGVPDLEIGGDGDVQVSDVPQEDDRDHVLQEEGHAHGGDQGGDGAPALEAAEDAELEEHAEERDDEDRGDEPPQDVRPQKDVDAVRGVRADGHHVPVGEVRELLDPVREGEAGRAQDVDAPDDDALDRELEGDPAERRAHRGDHRNDGPDVDGPPRDPVERVQCVAEGAHRHR